MQMDSVPQRYQWCLSSGEDDVEHSVLVPRRTLSGVASISKPILAFLIAYIHD